MAQLVSHPANALPVFPDTCLQSLQSGSMAGTMPQSLAARSRDKTADCRHERIITMTPDYKIHEIFQFPCYFAGWQDGRCVNDRTHGEGSAHRTRAGRVHPTATTPLPPARQGRHGQQPPQCAANASLTLFLCSLEIA